MDDALRAAFKKLAKELGHAITTSRASFQELVKKERSANRPDAARAEAAFLSLLVFDSLKEQWTAAISKDANALLAVYRNGQAYTDGSCGYATQALIRNQGTVRAAWGSARKLWSDLAPTADDLVGIVHYQHALKEYTDQVAKRFSADRARVEKYFKDGVIDPAELQALLNR